MMMGRMMGSAWGNWDSMPDYMKQMMQQYWGGVRPFWGLSGVFDLVIWVLVIALLVSAIRYLWNKGGKR